jgi:ketosteroid isomerase-like protein
MDMRLFGAFNALDADAIEKFFTEDVEFYHDKGGLTRSRDALVQTFRKKFSEKDSRLRRELIASSLEVYPLSDNGAIEMGRHRFFQTSGGQNEREVTVSRFVHVWQKSSGQWRISRAFSYDHRSVN